MRRFVYIYTYIYIYILYLFLYLFMWLFHLESSFLKVRTVLPLFLEPDIGLDS